MAGYSYRSGSRGVRELTTVRDDQLPRGAGDAAEVPAVPAASVIVMRGEPFEVLFMRRTSTSSFVPDAWVFPGGSVDPIDRQLAAAARTGSELDAARICALRELFEETGIWIGRPLDDAESTRTTVLDDPAAFAGLFEACAAELDRLVPTSRWITPVGVPKRFDTWFFLLNVDPRHHATPEHREGVEMRWIRPAEALRLHGARELSMVFPTIKNLEAIADYDRSETLLDSRRGLEIRPVQPILVVQDGKKRIVLPEEP